VLARFCYIRRLTMPSRAVAIALTPLLTPLLLLFPLAAIGTSCERERPRALPASAPAQPVTDLELKPVTPLIPGRVTHLAVDGSGNIYWSQEGDRRDDTMFVIGEGDIPRATQLSAGNIAAQLLNEHSGRGNIQGIATGPAGEVYFYFAGSAGRKALAAFGVYNPKTAKARLLAGTEPLSAATGMGRSIVLARGTVISDGRSVWLWVRHTDAWMIFKIDPAKIPPEGSVSLAPAFDKVLLEGQPLQLTRDEFELAPGPDQNLFLLDPPGGRLLKIDPNGRATLVRTLAGLPNQLSAPAVDRRGQILLFAGKEKNPDDFIRPATERDAAAPKPLDVTYPAMLFFDGENFVAAAESNRIRAYPGFPVYSMRLTQLVPNPAAEEWISYDNGSGELLRLKLRQKLWP
jgi:hypothetical protein